MGNCFLMSVVAFAATASCALVACAGQLTVAERGKEAEYSIVVPEKASPSQKYAAEELRDFTEKATGVRLPIVTDAKPIPAKAIVLGGADATGRVPPGMDGFRLKADGSRVFIIGSAERGTLYGVYEFLERFVGCRWYASWRTVVPKCGRIEVPADLDETQTPAFAMREPYWADVTDHPEFAARLRVNSRSWKRLGEKFGGDPYRFGGGLGSCHTFNTLLPPDKYFDTHPEYFRMEKGRRIREHTQLCLTNPNVLRIVTSNVLDRIRRDPGAKFYGVSQNDWGSACECPNCKAVDDEEGSHAGTMIRFVNAVAEAVEKEFPDVTIETLAYQYTRKAPKKTKLRHNVVPCLCTLECDFALPIDKSPFRENIAFRKDIEDWSRLTDFLYVWDYTTDFSHYTLPWPNVYALQGNIQFFRRHNVKALFAQGAYHGRHADFGELKAWLLAKWMWNPDLPMKELLDDFFTGYYGKGAPFVREYFERIHQLQVDYSARPDCPLLIFDGVVNPAIPDSFLEEAAELWDKAAAATKDDLETSYNVRMGAFSVDYARIERSRKLLNLTKSAFAIPPAKRKVIAQSLLDRMDEAKNLRLAESDRTEMIDAWRKIASGAVVSSPSASGELEEDLIPLSNRGKWGDIVDDPKAENGKALKLFNSHFSWCVQLPMNKIAFEPGERYRLSVRVRVDKARDGEAFWAGVHSKVASHERGRIAPRTADVPSGEYRWYDVLTWVPAPDEFLWIGPGRFNADGKSAVNGVFIDKLKLSPADDVVFENKRMMLRIGENACVKSLVVKATGEECLSNAEPMPLFAVTQERPFNNEIKLIHMHKRTAYPACSIQRIGERRLVVGFKLAPYKAVVEVDVKPSYMTFKLVDFIVKQEDYGDLKMDTPPVVSFRVLQLPVGKRKNFGDWINAMWDEKGAVGVLGTSVETFIDNEEHQSYMLLSADLQHGYRLRGGSAALVAAATPVAFLDAVGQMEADFGLPHGVLARRSPLTNASMLRVHDLNPQNVDQYIAVAKKIGVRLMLLYYTCIVKDVVSWGLNGNWDMLDAYPNGLADLKQMLDKLKTAGITPGLHFLHTHVGLRSRYVTPVADHRLNLTRRFRLARPLKLGDSELFVEENPLDSVMANGCRVLKFGGELISYDGYTTEHPYRFTGIRRGAWETKVVPHPAGEFGGILDVSEYWLPQSCYVDERTSLQDEIADKIAAVYGTGFEFAYFDGSEGVHPPYNYNVPYAQYRVWKKLSPEPIFAEAAAKAHFGWHMLAGANAFDIFKPEEFKQKIIEFPFAEAPLMRSNFTRLNFGWWQLYLPEMDGKSGKPSIGTQPDMWEFGMSRAAAWDCPTTINFHIGEATKHPHLSDILEVVRRWEDVRAKNWLTPEQKEMLKNPVREHHLYLNEAGGYELVEWKQIPVGGGKLVSGLRAFLFERGGKRVVAYWHTSGRARYVLADETGTEIETEGLKYFKTDLSAAAAEAAFMNSREVK